MSQMTMRKRVGRRMSNRPCMMIVAFFCIMALLRVMPVHAGLQEGIKAYSENDQRAALKELRPLADKGNAEAQYYLGLIHVSGKGVPADFGAALGWFRRAAEQGHAGAQHNLGLQYENGQGVPRDFKAAALW
jgi:TPR repeat protein